MASAIVNIEFTNIFVVSEYSRFVGKNVQGFSFDNFLNFSTKQYVFIRSEIERLANN